MTEPLGVVVDGTSVNIIWDGGQVTAEQWDALSQMLVAEMRKQGGSGELMIRWLREEAERSGETVLSARAFFTEKGFTITSIPSEGGTTLTIGPLDSAIEA